MPVIPMTSGSASASPAPQASETNLLMALAEMHKQGRIPAKAEPAPKKTRPKPSEGTL